MPSIKPWFDVVIEEEIAEDVQFPNKELVGEVDGCVGNSGSCGGGQSKTKRRCQFPFLCWNIFVGFLL